MFYAYRQNNSGGSFYGPINVIIEADSAEEADHIATTHADSPIYFDGCSIGRDCDCCGDRWYRAYDGHAEPLVYGEKPPEDTLILYKYGKKKESIESEIKEILTDFLTSGHFPNPPDTLESTQNKFEIATKKILKIFDKGQDS